MRGNEEAGWGGGRARNTKYVHIKSTTGYAPRRNWDSPQPPTRRLVCPLPPVSGGRGTLAGWYEESAFSNFLIFYLMLIFSDFAADHGLINYIETKAKGCHLKNLPVKGLWGRCLSEFIGLRQINNCRKVSLQVNFSDDNVLPFALVSI